MKEKALLTALTQNPFNPDAFDGAFIEWANRDYSATPEIILDELLNKIDGGKSIFIAAIALDNNELSTSDAKSCAKDIIDIVNYYYNLLVPRSVAIGF